MEHANLSPTCQISPNNAMVHCVITRTVVNQVLEGRRRKMKT